MHKVFPHYQLSLPFQFKSLLFLFYHFCPFFSFYNANIHKQVIKNNRMETWRTGVLAKATKKLGDNKKN